MCTWISACSKGDGKLLYFPKRLRDKIINKELWDHTHTNLIDDPDSHSQICAYYGVPTDLVNKYEFRPLDHKFIIDSIYVTKDAAQVEEKMRRLNFRRLAPPNLVLKPIVHPFKLPKRNPTKEDLAFLRKWSSVWGSVRDSVRGSVWDSVRGSVWDSVRDSVWDSVWDSVGGSVWDSVRGSVWDSVRDSVWDSVGAYTGSFFNLPRKAWLRTKNISGSGYPFQSTVTLWDRGLVPSFDGKLWRLHSGPNSEVVWEGK